MDLMRLSTIFLVYYCLKKLDLGNHVLRALSYKKWPYFESNQRFSVPD